MEGAVPRFGRLTFTIHLVVAICFGIGNLLFPHLVGSVFGFQDPGELVTDVRVLGAIILGLGGVTSFYCARARKWEQVDFVVRGELVYLAIQTLVYLHSLITGVGPALANVVFLAVSIVLFVLFLLTWMRRPRQA